MVTTFLCCNKDSESNGTIDRVALKGRRVQVTDKVVAGVLHLVAQVRLLPHLRRLKAHPRVACCSLSFLATVRPSSLC